MTEARRFDDRWRCECCDEKGATVFIQGVVLCETCAEILSERPASCAWDDDEFADRGVA